MQSVYHIQLDRGNLLTYLGAGLIYPAAMEPSSAARGNRESDPQTRRPGSLALSQGAIDDYTPDHVLVEVALSPREMVSLEGAVPVRLGQPLPISRIRAIFYHPDAGDIRTILRGIVFGDSFVPRQLVHHSTELGELPSAPSNEIAIEKENRAAVRGATGSEKMEAFDRLLGMMAFMRTAGGYFVETKRQYKSYPDSYIAAIWALVQDLPHGEEKAISFPEASAPYFLCMLCGSPPPDPLFESIFTSIRQNTLFDRDTSRDLARQEFKRRGLSAEDPVAEALKLLFLHGDYQGSVRILARRDEWLSFLILSVLYKFGKPESNDAVNLKDWVERDFVDPETASLLLAVLGFYYGYRRIPAREQLEIGSAVLSELVGARRSIKFGPESVMDRIVVEAIFQKTFLGEDASWSDMAEHLPGAREIVSETVGAPPEPLRGEGRLFFGERIWDLIIPTEDKSRKANSAEPAKSLAEECRRLYPDRIRVETGAVATFLARHWPDLGEPHKNGPYPLESVLNRINEANLDLLSELARFVAFDKELASNG